MGKAASKTKRRPPRRRPRRGSVDLKPTTFRREAGRDLPKVLGRRIVKSAPSAIAELVANGYDADAERINVVYDPDNEICYVKDNGNGMSSQEVPAFFRIADSTKLREPLSPVKKRRRLGEFGIATASLESLAERATLTTTKGGIESRVEEDMSKLFLGQKMTTHRKRAPRDRHGTTVTMYGLKFERSRFLRRLKTALQITFRKLTQLPDFSVFVNDEEIRPIAIEKATQFSFKEKGRHMGSVEGTIYLSPTRTSLSGLHISVNGRVIGNPSELIKKISTSQTIESRVIVDLEVPALNKAIMADRNLFQEDHPAFTELLEKLKPYLLEVRQEAEKEAALNAEGNIKRQRAGMAKAILREMRGARVKEVTPETIVVFDDHGGSESLFPCSFDPEEQTITAFNQGYLTITQATRAKGYREWLRWGIVEAVTQERAYAGEGKDPLFDFATEREEIWTRLERKKKFRKSMTGISPKRVYSLSELAKITGIDIGSLRFMVKGGMVPTKSRGQVKGADFVNARRETEGMVSLYDFLGKAGKDPNMSLPTFTKTFRELGRRAKPFILDFNQTGKGHCFFVEGACLSRLTEIARSKTFDGRSRRYGGKKAERTLDELRNQKLTPARLVRTSDGLSREEVKAIIRYGQEEGLLKAEETQYPYGDFITALQARRLEGVA